MKPAPSTVAPSGPALTLTLPSAYLESLTLIAPLAETLTQRNVLEVTGIPPRVYLTTIRQPGFPVPVGKLGKLRLVDRAAFVAWAKRADDAAPGEVGEDARLDAAARAELGLVAAPASRTRRRAGSRS